LREALAVDVLAGDDPGQEMRLLLRRAVHDDRGPDEALAHSAHDPGNASAVELLVEHGYPHGVQSLAAELLRPLRADVPCLLKLLSPLGVGRVPGRLGRALAAVAAGGDDVVPVDELG